jgi:hypothetical protein
VTSLKKNGSYGGNLQKTSASCKRRNEIIFYILCFQVKTRVLRLLPMPYMLKIFTADDVTDAQREQAVDRFRAALDGALGDERLVLPCYQAYLKLFHQYSEHPRPWPISADEQILAEQWEAAELAATQAAFGVHRYLGDADFEIRASN